ncbi:MAG: glycosyltransferase [Candidatus Bathyarchaeia archaeon]
MLSCTELGLGHVSRLMLLGKKLEEREHELFFFSGGTAYKLLKKEFKNVYHCTPVAWYENTRGIIVSASLLNILLPLPHSNEGKGKFGVKTPSGIETVHRYYDLRRNIRKIKPHLIISDGDMHALRLAHRWNFPSVYITNVIRPSYSFPSLLIPGERFTERYVKFCSKIIVPDNPMPYTVCEYNLGSLEDVGVKDKVEFVGSFIDMTPTEGSEEYIFAPISGPLGTKAKLKQIVIPVLSELKTKSIVSLGEQGKKISAKIGNCTIHTWLSPQERQECMANSKLIIFSGGHTTCFETIKHIKPSICIPTQPEQRANAKKMQDMKCSIIAENRTQLMQAIHEMENKIAFYKRNVQKLNQYSNKFKGVEKAVEIIEEAANF